MLNHLVVAKLLGHFCNIATNDALLFFAACRLVSIEVRTSPLGCRRIFSVCKVLNCVMIITQPNNVLLVFKMTTPSLDFTSFILLKLLIVLSRWVFIGSLVDLFLVCYRNFELTEVRRCGPYCLAQI